MTAPTINPQPCLNRDNVNRIRFKDAPPSLSYRSDELQRLLTRKLYLPWVGKLPPLPGSSLRSPMSFCPFAATAA
jgi:hypothetical protein